MKNNLLESGGAFDIDATVDDKAGRLADVAVLTWRRHDAALSPIIGRVGFAAVFRHCVSLRRRAHPWLEGAHQGVAGTGDFAALHLALTQCHGPQAAEAQGALMKCFHDLLVALIGKPLLQRALRAPTGSVR